MPFLISAKIYDKTIESKTETSSSKININDTLMDDFQQSAEYGV